MYAIYITGAANARGVMPADWDVWCGGRFRELVLSAILEADAERFHAAIEVAAVDAHQFSGA